MSDGRRIPNDLTGHPRHAREPRGAFVRGIGIAAAGDEVRAVLEDDFHHFRVTVRTAAGRVAAIEGEALRFPWTTCGQAGGALAALIGAELAASAPAVQANVDSGAQCTHLLELAGVAIAVAARGVGRRAYRMVVTDADAAGRRRAGLERDGSARLAWDLRDGRVESPQLYVGQPLGRGFTGWASRTLEPEAAEAAVLLRRAVHISGGRSVDLDALERPFRIVPCFTLSEPRIREALRVKGSAQDFSDAALAPTATDADWLDAVGAPSPVDSGEPAAQKTE